MSPLLSGFQIRCHVRFDVLLACVAGVKRGRGNLGARGRKNPPSRVVSRPNSLLSYLRSDLMSDFKSDLMSDFCLTFCSIPCPISRTISCPIGCPIFCPISVVRFHLRCLVRFLDRDFLFDVCCPIWGPFFVRFHDWSLVRFFVGIFVQTFVRFLADFLSDFMSIFLFGFFVRFIVRFLALFHVRFYVRFLVRSFVRTERIGLLFTHKNGDFGAISSREGNLAIVCNHSLLHAITQAHFYPNFC